MNHLLIQNITKTYPGGVCALNNLHLDIGPGLFGLLGPNGAGKSSLMRTIASLQLPTSGNIFLNGTDILAEPGYIKKQLGYLPQDFGVYPKITASQLLEHMAVLKGIANKAERREQVLALLQMTNLYEHRNKAVHTYSGGMRQRFGIAQALLGNPGVIIVDEPTAGLDPEERNRFNNLLSEIGEEVIIILSTHIVEDVRNLCPKMAIMDKGRILATGEPATFINRIEGKVWQRVVNRDDLQHFIQSYRVISSQLIGGKPSIRVYSENMPGEGFVAAKAGLEDVYFTYLKNLEVCLQPA